MIVSDGYCDSFLTTDAIIIAGFLTAKLLLLLLLWILVLLKVLHHKLSDKVIQTFLVLSLNQWVQNGTFTLQLNRRFRILSRR